MPGLWQRFRAWGKDRIVDPFKEYLRQDTEPPVLARSAVTGFFLGLCPVVGVSAGLCLLACFLLRSHLHAPMTLLFNFVAVPVEIGLIVPFMRLGELVLGAQRVNVVPKHFSDLFKAGEALRGLGHALLGWLLVCLPLAWPAAAVLTPLFALLRRRYASLTRVGSDSGPLLDAPAVGDSHSTVSDVEMAAGADSPKSPASQRGGGGLTPRNSGGAAAGGGLRGGGSV